MKSRTRRLMTGLVLAAGLLAGGRQAHANKYGELHITGNTTLTDHRFGSVVFDSDNITLDCAGRQVHISSYSKPNCFSHAWEKCAIVAEGRTGISVKNCTVVGNFYAGVAFSGTNNASITDTSADSGFVFSGNQNLHAKQLVSNGCPSAPYVIFHDTNGSYNFLAAGSPGDYGFMILESSGTILHGLSSAYATDVGLSVSRSTSISISLAEIDHGQTIGIAFSNSSNISLTGGSSARSNKFEGLFLDNTDNSIISGNYFQDNDGSQGCDAFQSVDSTGNAWIGNSLSTWCGTVPASH